MSWAKIALWVIGVITTIIIGSLGTSTYAILDGLWRLNQVEKENARQDGEREKVILQFQKDVAERRAADQAMWSVLNNLTPTVGRIDERTEQMDGRMQRLEARQDRR